MPEAVPGPGTDTGRPGLPWPAGLPVLLLGLGGSGGPLHGLVVVVIQAIDDLIGDVDALRHVKRQTPFAGDLSGKDCIARLLLTLSERAEICVRAWAHPGSARAADLRKSVCGSAAVCLNARHDLTREAL